MKSLFAISLAFGLMSSAAFAANTYSTTADGMQGSSTGYAGGSVSDGATPPLDRTGGMEATDSPHIENDNRQGAKVYTKNMSKDDYDANLRTKNKGQTTIQPEKGLGQ